MKPEHISPPTVFVVDDDESVRRALARLLRSTGYEVSVFASAADFLAVASPAGPGCAIVDLQMPVLGGLDLQAEMAARGIRIPIIFLTGHGDVPAAVKALKGGAIDFMTKPFRAMDLLATVRVALEKDGARRAAADEHENVRQRFATLTGREREVLMLVISGFLNKQIAAELGNSERTVKVHRARVMLKMNAQSVAQLTRMIDRAGLQQENGNAP